MTKSLITRDENLSVRISPMLRQQLEEGAKQRGQSLSEFARYILTLFFENSMVYEPHNSDSKPVQAS